MVAKITLITGASSGIGAEFAKIFALNGHRTALVGRSEDRLKALAQEIAARGCLRPIVFACDLKDPGAGDRIAGLLSDTNLEVATVVNNAGAGLFGDAIELDRYKQLEMVDLNARVLTELTLRFLPAIVQHRGGILNVASIVSFLSGPRMAVYHATKAYVLSFTEAIRSELKDKGVKVTALCPGPVPTQFQERAGFQSGFDSRILGLTASVVARAGYDGLMSNKRLVVPGIRVRMIPFMLRFAPRSLVLASVARIHGKR